MWNLWTPICTPPFLFGSDLGECRCPRLTSTVLARYTAKAAPREPSIPGSSVSSSSWRPSGTISPSRKTSMTKPDSKRCVARRPGTCGRVTRTAPVSTAIPQKSNLVQRSRARHGVSKDSHRDRTSSFLTLDYAGTANFALQEKHAVEQRLRGRRTAGNVDVDGNDAVAPSHHRIGVVVVAAAIGARSHGNDIARFRHLVVDLAQGRGHLVA